jgi:HTH-type transcriptional regulator/antitoxin MqsA
METRYCLQCDDGTALVYGTKDMQGEIFGEPYEVPAVTGWHCPVCGEIEFCITDDSADRVKAVMEMATKAARACQADELRKVRKQLGLTQAEAGRLFGGGATAFSEYEHCKTQPHRSTVLLLRMLGKHPELLDEVRTAAASV